MNTFICRVLLLLTYDLHQHTLSPAPIELAVEYLFPRTEVESALGHRDNHFTPHHLSFEMGVGVIFAGTVMPILAQRLVWGQSFQPLGEVVVQAGLVIIDEN